MICGSGGSKGRLAKVVGAGPAGQMRDQKLHAVVARSAFPRKKCKTLTGKVEMLKSGRRCGAKHISKSECSKHTTFSALLETEMWKKCTPLWREARFQVKSVKN